MEERHELLRHRIIEACTRQINIRGIKGFTMDDLAKDLSISKKTVYKHFRSKDEIIQSYLKNSLEDNISRTMMAVEKESTLIAKIESALISYHKYVLPIEVLEDLERYHPEGWKMIEDQRRFKVKLFTDLVAEGVASGELRRDIHWEVLALMLDKSTKALLEYPFLHQHQLSVNDAVREMVKIILCGIVSKTL